MNRWLLVCFPNAIAARVNNKTVGMLYERITTSKSNSLIQGVVPLARAYVRTLTFVVSAAVSELFPEGKFKLEHPVAKGYFCKLDLGRPTTEEDLKAVKKRVQELIAADNPIGYVEDETSVVIEMFRERHRISFILLTT